MNALYTDVIRLSLWDGDNKSNDKDLGASLGISTIYHPKKNIKIIPMAINQCKKIETLWYCDGIFFNGAIN